MMARRALSAIVIGLAVLLAIGALASDLDDLTAGVWTAAAGPETYHWQLWITADGGLAGVVHVMSGGRKKSEVPIDRAEWQAPELVMHVDATGVDYRGTVDLAAGRITGTLFMGDRRLQAMDLHQSDPEKIAGLHARPLGSGPWCYVPPPRLDDGWEVGDLADAGLTAESLGALVAAVEAGEAGVVHSLLLIAGGKLVAEEYFHGYERSDLHRLASVTKSVSALLVGQAIDAGEIAGVEAPVLDFFPGLRKPEDARWTTETLHHLLSMSMGLAWEDGGNSHGTGPAFFQQVLDRPVSYEPGTHWAYQSANVNLLAGVLKQATGRHADQVAQQRLFTPLGITAFDWDFLATDGYRLMDGSLRLRPRDMAKVGLLVRDEGRWQGRQIVSADWIRRMISPQIATDGPEQYGYLWWLGNVRGPGGQEPVVFAHGRGSQFVVWMPRRDLIVVTTGGNEDNGKEFSVMRVLARLL